MSFRLPSWCGFMTIMVGSSEAFCQTLAMPVSNSRYLVNCEPTGTQQQLVAGVAACTVCCQSVQLRLVDSWNIFQCIQIFLSFIGECQPGHGGLDNSIKSRLPRQIAPPYDSHSKETEFCRESAVPEQGWIFWWKYPGQITKYHSAMQ